MEMGNIILFAEMYRNMGFDGMPFGEPDSLILSQLSYYNYKDSGFESGIFGETVSSFLHGHTEEAIEGLITSEHDRELAAILEQGGRHGSLRACGFTEVRDHACDDCGKQFAAITFDLGNGVYYIAYRGTDNSVTGWKEDMNLSFSREIPAQKDAVGYAKKMMDLIPGRFYLGGHSKGGNLAIYTALNLPEEYLRRIDAVYNHDGPGFWADIYESETYRRIRSMIYKTVPVSSVIGMIWEMDDNYRVVKSSADGLFQHDPYSWIIMGTDFDTAETVDQFSVYVRRVMDNWLEEIHFEDRKRIIDTVFRVIEATGISLFHELETQPGIKIRALLEEITDIEKNDRKLVASAVRRFFSISAGEAQQMIKERGKYKQFFQKGKTE